MTTNPSKSKRFLTRAHLIDKDGDPERGDIAKVVKAFGEQGERVGHDRHHYLGNAEKHGQPENDPVAGRLANRAVVR